jgi:3-isopropylmalate dehydrogenase
VLLPGDGIGPEVIAAAEEVLTGVAALRGHDLTFERHRLGGVALREGDKPLPDGTLRACLASHAILLGAVGDPAFDREPPERRPERGLLDLRKALGAFANLRPARIWPGLEPVSPLKPDRLRGTDFIIVRELTGGLYYGEPRARGSHDAVNTLRYTREEIERIAHVAFREARRRGQHLTSVDKANVLEVSQLWRETVTAVAASYPEIRVDHLYVDNCAMQIALNPAQFGVVLTENLFGDILSDEAGAIVGSLGLLPSASIGGGPGLFEPVHGSAPGIAGLGIANPIGAIASAAMLLRHGLQLEQEAAMVESACERALRSGTRTPDIGGTARTEDVTRAVIAGLATPPSRSSPGS